MRGSNSPDFSSDIRSRNSASRRSTTRRPRKALARQWSRVRSELRSESSTHRVLSSSVSRGGAASWLESWHECTNARSAGGSCAAIELELIGGLRSNIVSGVVIARDLPTRLNRNRGRSTLIVGPGDIESKESEWPIPECAEVFEVTANLRVPARLEMPNSLHSKRQN